MIIVDERLPTFGGKSVQATCPGIYLQAYGQAVGRLAYKAKKKEGLRTRTVSSSG